MNLNLQNDGFERVSCVNAPDYLSNRISTGDSNLDAIFGGGLLPGSTCIIHANAGAGKTSFCLDICERLTRLGKRVKYASGEESKAQLSITGKRLGANNVNIGNVTDIDELTQLTYINDLIVIDSFQTLTCKDKKITKSKIVDYCIRTLIAAVKQNGCILIFILQENGKGEIRGGPSLSFFLDVQMEILRDDEEDPNKRIFAVIKNRFGVTGLFHADLTSTGYVYRGKYDVPKIIATQKKFKGNKKVVDYAISLGMLVAREAIARTVFKKKGGWMPILKSIFKNG
jgi:predicted ATP-dependent serine protease